MPIYEYICLQCKKGHEFMQKFSDDPISTCPTCGGEMKKLISNTSFVLKGSGWYMTDYGSKKDVSKDTSKDKSEKSPDKKKSGTSKKKTESVSTS